MNARRLDRRVRKEARSLLREAKGALGKKPDLKGKAGGLAPVALATEKALRAVTSPRCAVSSPCSILSSTS